MKMTWEDHKELTKLCRQYLGYEIQDTANPSRKQQMDREANKICDVLMTKIIMETVYRQPGKGD